MKNTRFPWFLLDCIRAFRDWRRGVKVTPVDLRSMSQGEIAAFVHGRPIDWKAVQARKAAGP